MGERQTPENDAACRIEDGVCSRHTPNNPTCVLHAADSTPTEREAGDVGEVAARVRALADEWEKCIRDPRRRPGWSGGAILADLRAALDGEA